MAVRTWQEMRAAIAQRLERRTAHVQARKTYTTLLTPRRTFAAVRPTTKRRVDLVMRLEGVEPGGRLLDGRNSAGGGLNLRIALASVDDFDDEAAALLRAAYDGSL